VTTGLMHFFKPNNMASLPESNYDGIVFVNGHSDFRLLEKEDLKGIQQTTICLAERGMPSFVPDKFIRKHLAEFMNSCFSANPQSICKKAISKIKKSCSKSYAKELESNKFDKSQGICSNVPTQFRNKVWQFHPNSLYSVVEFDASNTDGIYLLTSTMSKPLTILKQPVDKIVTMSKNELLEILKNQHGLTNVLIIDAGCNILHDDSDTTELIEDGQIVLGGTHRYRKRNRKTRKYKHNPKR